MEKPLSDLRLYHLLGNTATINRATEEETNELIRLKEELVWHINKTEEISDRILWLRQRILSR